MANSSEKPVVVVGSINLDFVAFADEIPVPGQTVLGGNFETHFGGKGANQAVAAAKIGARVEMIGCVGSDSFGGQLIQGLQSAGVKTGAVSQVPGPSGVALITTDRRGENSIVVIPGANAHVTPSLLEKHDALLRSAAIILVQLEIPLESVEFLASRAAAHGVSLILDPAPARTLSPSLLSRCTWITPNETEARILSGGEGHSAPKKNIDDKELDDDETVARLRSLGAKNILLKQGSRGVAISECGSESGVASGGPLFHVPGFSVNAVDTTAAGDAFNGAFAAALVSGKSVAESARFANAVAALSVTRKGAQPSMPTRSEVESFLGSGGGNREGG
ncbi:MAG TPA: ribokinase [Candidatus Acidoferrum sp.]|nr:ribokinase [Candidatus Acidoferrum sp.]